MASSRIMGSGHYLPPKVVTNFDVMEMMETSDEFIVERTGVRCRRHAEPGIGASSGAPNHARPWHSALDPSHDHASDKVSLQREKDNQGGQHGDD